jgi:hypothetical protein
MPTWKRVLSRVHIHVHGSVPKSMNTRMPTKPALLPAKASPRMAGDARFGLDYLTSDRHHSSVISRHHSSVDSRAIHNQRRRTRRS